MIGEEFVSRVWHRYLRVPYTLNVYQHSVVAHPRATLVFLHGLGNSGATWERVVSELPDDINVVIVDLLGFGDSPAPDWAKYDAKTQAHALAKTLVLLGVRQRVTLVGHSMGSLIAVEFAKRFPLVVESLVLCSPPLYKKTSETAVSGLRGVERDELLRRLYVFATKEEKNVARMAYLSARSGLKTPEFDISKINTDSYKAALQDSIISQSAMDDIVTLPHPISILYGTLDPMVIGKNIREVATLSENISVQKYVVPHEVIGKYVTYTAQAIDRMIARGE